MRRPTLSTKPILVFQCFIFALFASNAQATEPTLTPTSVLPKSPCSFAGDFTQSKTITGLDKALESAGSFYYHCQDGVIWSTHSPIKETLIFSRSGDHAKVIEQRVSKLKGRQSKLLGKLLNSMMGGNQTEIEQQFELHNITNSSTEFELLPKKKSLKRAIKKIHLAFTKPENTDLQKINIQIKDRKNQLTSITSSQTHIFAVSDHSTALRNEQCLTGNIARLACNKLYPQAE